MVNAYCDYVCNFCLCCISKSLYKIFRNVSRIFNKKNVQNLTSVGESIESYIILFSYSLHEKRKKINDIKTAYRRTHDLAFLGVCVKPTHRSLVYMIKKKIYVDLTFRNSFKHLRICMIFLYWHNVCNKLSNKKFNEQIIILIRFICHMF